MKTIEERVKILEKKVLVLEGCNPTKVKEDLSSVNPVKSDSTKPKMVIVRGPLAREK